jgi:competence protein ComEA
MSRVIVALLSAVAAVVLVGFIARAVDERSAPPIVIDDPLQNVEIVVSVEGAVATPGVYRLPADARYQDAVDAAGGPAEFADLALVNLARRVRDEDRILIPARGVGGMTASAAVPGDATLLVPTGGEDLLDLNRATGPELESLPGIGPVLAARIIETRIAQGRFESVDDLALVPGISRKLAEDLRSLVTVAP